MTPCVKDYYRAIHLHNLAFTSVIILYDSVIIDSNIW